MEAQTDIWSSSSLSPPPPQRHVLEGLLRALCSGQSWPRWRFSLPSAPCAGLRFHLGRDGRLVFPSSPGLQGWSSIPGNSSWEDQGLLPLPGPKPYSGRVDQEYKGLGHPWPNFQVGWRFHPKRSKPRRPGAPLPPSVPTCKAGVSFSGKEGAHPQFQCRGMALCQRKGRPWGWRARQLRLRRTDFIWNRAWKTACLRVLAKQWRARWRAIEEAGHSVRQVQQQRSQKLIEPGREPRRTLLGLQSILGVL